MELIRKPIHYTQEGKSIFDQFYLDEDYNVPDQREDVQRIISGNAWLRAEDIRPVENYVKVTGKVHFKILYMTASGDPRPAALEGQVPFEEMVYAQSDGNEAFFMRNSRIEFTPSVVHSRKLGLKFMAEIEIGRECIRDEELTEDVQSDVPVYLKTSKMNLLKLSVSKKDTYRIKEEITLPGTKESIGQMVLADVSVRKLDIRMGQDEILLRGELLLFCMYLSAGEKADWLEQSVPFEGRILCDGAAEHMYYHIQHSLEDTLTDLRLDEDGEMRIIGIEATLSLRMNLFEEEETMILTDLYSLEQKCTFETRETSLEELLMQNQSKCKVSERISLPELKEDVLQILHSRGCIQVESEEHQPEGIRIEGILHLSFLYLRGDDSEPYGSWQGMIPFSYLIEYPDMPEDVISSLAYHVEQLAVTLAGSETVEVKAVLSFDVFLRKLIPVQIITNVNTEPLDMEAIAEQPGIVGHIVQEGEDLWQLAKKYMTTVQGIMEINGLNDENISQGDKLLIFKENMSIL
nr:SPOCS domain-containing protein [uncultured Mediterraneibacter sp.]